MTTAKKFENDEQGYTAWLQAYPAGYVLNAHKKPKSWYLVLHRASCASISQPTKRAKPGGFTTRTFVKVVAEQEAELKQWIRQNAFTDFSALCKLCFKNT